MNVIIFHSQNIIFCEACQQKREADRPISDSGLKIKVKIGLFAVVFLKHNKGDEGIFDCRLWVAASRRTERQIKIGPVAYKSKLSEKSKYDMYYNSYTDTSPVPDVMDDLTEHGAKNGDVVRWLAAYDSAKGVGREAVEETLRRGYTADQSAGGDTAAQMKALLGTNMTARELEAVYFGMMVSSQAKERRREQFDKLHDAGGNAVDFFEAYVAVAETSWKTKESGAKSKALKRAIDGVTSDRRVRKELYDIFDVAKSMR